MEIKNTEEFTPVVGTYRPNGPFELQDELMGRYNVIPKHHGENPSETKRFDTALLYSILGTGAYILLRQVLVYAKNRK